MLSKSNILFRAFAEVLRDKRKSLLNCVFDGIIIKTCVII